MKKKNHSGRSTPPAPPSEDEVLWQRVRATADPLRKGKNRVTGHPDPVCDGEVRIPPAKETPAKPRRNQGVGPAKSPLPPPVAAFERKEARRLGSGRTSVDARIDLHGMRQGEAHRSLKAFLARAQGQGHRHVLVITGKGGKRESDGSFERGVLNREAPRWLSEPEFRQWVVSFTSASKRHGGEGALYVRIRRNRQS